MKTIQLILFGFSVLVFVRNATAQESLYFRILVASSNDPSSVVGEGFGRLTGNRFLCNVVSGDFFHDAALYGPAAPGANAPQVIHVGGRCDVHHECSYGTEVSLTLEEAEQLRAGQWYFALDANRGQILFDRTCRFTTTNAVEFTAMLDGENPTNRHVKPRQYIRWGRATFGLTGNSLSYELRLPASYAPYYALIKKPSFHNNDHRIGAIGTLECTEPLASPPPDATGLELLPTCVFRGATCVEDLGILELLAGDGVLLLYSPLFGGFGGYIVPWDNDHDGVPDFRDRCLDTPASGIVDTNGCSIAQLCPCDGPWKNHGHYVKCVREATTQFVKAGLITRRQQRAIVHQAVHSDCGKTSWHEVVNGPLSGRKTAGGQARK